MQITTIWCSARHYTCTSIPVSSGESPLNGSKSLQHTSALKYACTSHLITHPIQTAFIYGWSCLVSRYMTRYLLFFPFSPTPKRTLSEQVFPASPASSQRCSPRLTTRWLVRQRWFLNACSVIAPWHRRETHGGPLWRCTERVSGVAFHASRQSNDRQPHSWMFRLNLNFLSKDTVHLMPFINNARGVAGASLSDAEVLGCWHIVN